MLQPEQILEVLEELQIIKEDDGNYGKSKNDGKWYGWGKGGVFAYGIGDELTEGDTIVVNGGQDLITIDNDDEAKQCAKLYSQLVSNPI